LMFARAGVRNVPNLKNAPQLKEDNSLIYVFINRKGEIVFYFEEGYEGFEGTKPIQVK
jgi:hypothetical protein